MQSTVAALILAFAYRCGGSDGIAAKSGAPSSRLIPGLSSPKDTCRLVGRLSQMEGFVNRLVAKAARLSNTGKM